MKKLLSLLAATGLVATTSATVVACGDPTPTETAQEKLLNEIEKSIKDVRFNTKIELEEKIKEFAKENVFIKDQDGVTLTQDSLVFEYKINEPITREIEIYTVDLTVYATKEVTTANYDEAIKTYEIDEATKAIKTGIQTKIGVDLAEEIGKTITDSKKLLESKKFSADKAVEEAKKELEDHYARHAVVIVGDKLTNVEDNKLLLVVTDGTEGSLTRWTKEGTTSIKLEVFENDGKQWKTDSSASETVTVKTEKEEISSLGVTLEDGVEITEPISITGGAKRIEITIDNPELSDEGKIKGKLAIDKNVTTGSSAEFDLETVQPDQYVEGDTLRVVYKKTKENVITLEIIGKTTVEQKQTLSFDYDTAHAEIEYIVQM